MQRLADLLGGSVQLELWDCNLKFDDLELFTQKETNCIGSVLGQWKEVRFVVMGGGCHVVAVVGGGNLCSCCEVMVRESCVVLEAGFEAEFLEGENRGGCVVQTRRGKTGRYIPLREGNNLYVMTVGHLLEQGERCQVVCKCRGEPFTTEGKCVLRCVPQNVDPIFDIPDAALVKLVHGETPGIAHAFQHRFIRHGCPLHLTLPPQTLSVTRYYNKRDRLLVFRDGNTEPIKGTVSCLLARTSAQSLVQGRFGIHTEAPLYRGTSGSVVCLDDLVLGLVVARNRGSRKVLVCNTRYALDYLCRGSKQYGDRAANFQVFSHGHQ